MNLGRKIEQPSVQAPQERPSVAYPSFQINDEKVSDFLKQWKVGMGDKVTATVKLKVSGMSDQAYGKSLSFDVLEISDVEGASAKDSVFAALRAKAKAQG